MDVIVPTRGRVGRQRTLQFLAPELRERTIMVAPAHEYQRHLNHDYMRGVRFMQQPDPNMTIARKRAWILRTWTGEYLQGVPPEGHSDKILMLDDDLRFYVRREDRPDRLRYAEAADQVHWFAELEKVISAECPHGGFGQRAGNNQQSPGWQSPGRMMYALGYHVPTVVSRCELGRIETREDFDITLQLLRQGLPNMINHTCVVGQASYNEEGGASLERTLESSNQDAQKLAELHPGLVRVVHKEYKNSPRMEVVVSWVKALREGTANAEG